VVQRGHDAGRAGLPDLGQRDRVGGPNDRQVCFIAVPSTGSQDSQHDDGPGPHQQDPGPSSHKTRKSAVQRHQLGRRVRAVRDVLQHDPEVVLQPVVLRGQLPRELRVGQRVGHDLHGLQRDRVLVGGQLGGHALGGREALHGVDPDLLWPSPTARNSANFWAALSFGASSFALSAIE